MISGNIDECCGCGACQNVCPVNTINLILAQNGNRTAEINYDLCIKCNKCNKVCPIQNENNKLFPISVFVGWNTNKSQQLRGSSGGVASAIMHYALESSDTDCYATVWYYEIGCYTKRIDNIEDLNNATGSKYIESQTEFCFNDIKESLTKGKKIIFIGLPCQCAAIKLFFNKFLERIILIDLICHGGVPDIYFKQHLKKIEKKYSKVTEKLSFRNPVQGYCLSLFEKGSNRPFYSNKMHGGKDLYYLAFRENLIFKEACYKCQYANEKRVTDITIGDYSGLGDLWEYTGKEKKVNCILVMTEKGKQFIELLTTNNLLNLIERPLSEPMSGKGNPQLREPNKITAKHVKFIEYYKKNKNFERAINKVLYGISLKIQFENFCFFIYRCFRFIPRRIWWKINGTK